MEIDDPIMRSEISGELRRISDMDLPVADFLTTYWPFNPETQKREFVDEVDRKITPEVAVQYLPFFQAIEREFNNRPVAEAKRINELFGLSPDQVSSMAVLLELMSAHSSGRS